MNIDILHRPTALENLLAGRIWPAGRRLPMNGLDATNQTFLVDCHPFSLFCVLPVNCREVYILKFILTFHLAMDARLHQKTKLRAENQP